jgi:hypothetical protein
MVKNNGTVQSPQQHPLFHRDRKTQQARNVGQKAALLSRLQAETLPV